MRNRIPIAIALIIATATTPLFAQRAQVSAWGGWTFSDGVEAQNSVVGPNGQIYNRIDPKDSGHWGFDVGFLAGENAEFGFMYSNQFSQLLVGGTTDTEIGDMSVRTYHGYFQYNFGAAESPVRPYVFGGFGATNYGSVD